MKINSSTPSFSSQIAKTTKKLSKVFEQLSSGKKINRASDDAAGLALVNALKSQISGLDTANRNISTAQGALSTASGAISQSVEQLQSLRDLAVQSANGTLSSDDRANLQNQFSQGVQNLDQISSTTSFNGSNLLDGSFNQSIQSGSQAGQTNDVAIGNLSSSTLGVGDQNISTQSAAQDAIAKIDAAIASANSENSKIGASQNALEFRESANAIERENLEAARSEKEDADFAEATAELSKERLIQQAQISVLNEQIKQKFTIANQFFGNKK